MNCSSDFKYFANSQPSASSFKSFSESLEHFFLTVGQNNFVDKIPLETFLLFSHLILGFFCKRFIQSNLPITLHIQHFQTCYLLHRYFMFFTQSSLTESVFVLTLKLSFGLLLPKQIHIF